ncbi:hypothetical protein J1N35_041640 [Gossypium stocksii]|uniref:Uncharacterized protein n=1 Tax=Gossypium stocksii TaxID=47602 RepID=A0A9D3ZJG8_9ROSI|nr:hypothetical protein J1N35_041640 [Gossypium stocksii]
MSEGSNRKAMTVVPAGIGLVVPAPKFKQRKVSAIWDFPPGCGRVTAPSSRSSEVITVDRSSQGADTQEFLVLYVIRCVIVP